MTMINQLIGSEIVANGVAAQVQLTGDLLLGQFRLGQFMDALRASVVARRAAEQALALFAAVVCAQERNEAKDRRKHWPDPFENLPLQWQLDEANRSAGPGLFAALHAYSSGRCHRSRICRASGASEIALLQ